MEESIDGIFITKFIVLWLVFSAMSWYMAPTLKWKILFTFASAIGTYLALTGRSLRSR